MNNRTRRPAGKQLWQRTFAERKAAMSRFRAILKAWPVRFVEERLPAGYPADARDFVVGDTETRFIVRPLYPDENDLAPRPGATVTTSRAELLKLCRQHLR